MIIPIDDKYRLKSDVDQWMIQKFTPTKKEPKKWTSIKYFANPSNAVTELVQMRIRASDAETLVDALEDAKKATASVLEALAPCFDVDVWRVER
jgi:hypothetical protein